MRRQIRFLIPVLLLVGLTCGSAVVAQKKKPRIKYYQISTNQTFHVRLGQTLNSGKARVGDTFTTTVVDPVYSTNGIELVPAGSVISGRVTAVEKARKDGNPGTLSVVFYNLKLPNNRAAAMSRVPSGNSAQRSRRTPVIWRTANIRWRRRRRTNSVGCWSTRKRPGPKVCVCSALPWQFARNSSAPMTRRHAKLVTR